jgi:VIT1/CCC1 family predicted Fe2+/Mn2+ transporter
VNPPGRPDSGPGHYLRDIVYGALDGVITTLAIVSGASGAALEPRIGLILGMANVVADGISMGASNYLGLKSELQQTGGSVAREQPLRHGVATTVAFAVAGVIPLASYFIPRSTVIPVFGWAVMLSGGVLLLLGLLRAGLAGQRPLQSVLEVLAIGALASGAAWAVGRLAQLLLGA